MEIQAQNLLEAVFSEMREVLVEAVFLVGQVRKKKVVVSEVLLLLVKAFLEVVVHLVLVEEVFLAQANHK